MAEAETQLPDTQLMEEPASIQGCPPGLEYLSKLEQILIQQQVEIFEVLYAINNLAITDIETENRYSIKNALGQQCYFAREDSSFFQRICCGVFRGFQFQVTDNNEREVFRMKRKFKCCSGCCWCANNDHCAFYLEVESNGTLLGAVRQS
ncbi:phospholipid scramblase 1-like [Ciona intestinalis]